MEQLMVGVGQEVITPALGTMLMGYTPKRPALGVHDDLHVTAFALTYGQVQVLYLSLDLCNMYYPEDEIRARISAACSVPADHIIMSCTHTHSGPATHQDDERPNYMEDIFIPAAIKASVDAVANRKPAQMGIGQTYSEVAVNRRKIKEDGTVILGQNPHGSWDPTMTVISFREPDGTPIGNIIQYGCHNTASGRNDDVTRDWCGVAIDRLQQQSGGITAFINGCGGDCGPRLPNGWSTGNLQMAMELGGKAAIDAVRAWKSIKVWQNVPLKVLAGQIEMPLQDIGTEAQVLEQAAALGDPESLKGTMRSSYDRLMERAEYLHEGNIPPKVQILPCTVLALGPLAIMPLPFEPFSMVTLRIKDYSPFPYTLCPGYSNGAMSYFPSADQIVRGGYEVRMFKTIRLIPFAENAEQHLVAGCLKLLRTLNEQE